MAEKEAAITGFLSPLVTECTLLLASLEFILLVRVVGVAEPVISFPGLGILEILLKLKFDCVAEWPKLF